MTHKILFLAADGIGAAHLALDREARAIALELERSAMRAQFELVTWWATEPQDLLYMLRKHDPTVVHFGVHGAPAGAPVADGLRTRRDIVAAGDAPAAESGLYFQGPDGRARLVSTAALAAAFGASGASVQVVVLNACYSEVHALALLAHVDCVVGMSGAIDDDAARDFAIGFYGGLGAGASVAAAFRQGCAAIDLTGLPDGDLPQLRARDGTDPERLVLADPPLPRLRRQRRRGPPRQSHAGADAGAMSRGRNSPRSSTCSGGCMRTARRTSMSPGSPLRKRSLAGSATTATAG